MLDIFDLQFGFDEPLVSGFGFSVAPGQMRIIHGESGCGKSTLLALISGTQNPSLKWQGQIRLDGADIGHLPPHQRSVGLIYQEPLLFPHLSVGENLAFGLASSARGAERKMAVRDALEAAGLSGFEKRDPASLSGGQAARIVLMRALLANPKVLLLDEAFSSLDTKLRRQFGRFVVAQIKARAIPALLVSHDVGDAEFASGDVLNLMKE